MTNFNNSIKNRLTGRHKFSFKLCGNVRGLAVLDVGSSFGWFEKFAVAAKAKKMVGIEPERTFYQAKKEVPRAIFKQGSALDIPEKTAVFDLVVMFDVIEHIPVGTESIALSEINRILKPGGKFVLSTDFDHPLSKAFDPAWYFGHRHYSEKKLRQLFKKAGFKIEQVYRRGGFFEITGTILLYVFKWIFHREIPFKKFFEIHKNREYLEEKDGIVTIFIKATKS
jgi:SAM-dependent methyltransferase